MKSTLVAVPLRNEDRMQILRVDDGIATGAIGCVAVSVIREAVTTERFRVQRESLQTTLRRCRKRTVMLAVTEASAMPPSEELKLAYVSMLEAYADELRGIACVVEGDGFRAAAMRSAISSIHQMLTRRSFPFRVFTSVAQASTWIATLEQVSDGGLREATEELRVFLDADESITQVRRREV